MNLYMKKGTLISPCCYCMEQGETKHDLLPIGNMIDPGCKFARGQGKCAGNGMPVFQAAERRGV